MGIMTKKEYEICINLMNEAFKNVEKSEEYFAELRDEQLSETDKKVKELMGQNALGYAQGINQALAKIGFKHEKMIELQRLI